MAKLLWTAVLLLSGRLLPITSDGSALAAGPALQPGYPAVPSDQGVEGIVYPVSGNQMPSPDRKAGPPGVKKPGIRSTVYIFELTNSTQVTRQGQSSYYPVINTKLVKQADTDDTGYFKIKLPPGLYSIFTRKGDLFYASRRDEKNNIAPVEVIAGKFTWIDCKIEGDRKAVY